MHTITQQQFEDMIRIKPASKEVFELTSAESIYLDVKAYEREDGSNLYIGTMYQYPNNIGFYSSSYLWEMEPDDEGCRRYAIENAVYRGQAQETRIVYDSLAEALKHASDLLSEHSKNI